jgi:hypothetical protein
MREKFLVLSNNIVRLRDSVTTEEATKHSFVMPFLQTLGYDVFDPTLVVPEFTADIRSKKGEKVDYAILQNNEPIILIEVKTHTENLNNHTKQIERYFPHTNAKFGILTNGIEYRFFSDLEKENVLDTTPFLIVDMLNLKERDFLELEKFTKDKLDFNNILSLASRKKYINGIKEIFEKEIQNPSNDFAKFFASHLLDGKRLTQPILDDFKKHISSSFKEIIHDIALESINTIKSALNTKNDISSEDEGETPEDEIITTDEEVTGFFIIKSIVCKEIALDRIFARDTKSYFGVLLDDNNRKWVCRLHFNTKQKYIGLHENDKEETKYKVDKIEDIYLYESKIKEIVKRLNS